MATMAASRAALEHQSRCLTGPARLAGPTGPGGVGVTVAGSLRRAECAQLGSTLGRPIGPTCIPAERDAYGG
jgi:hypothetical protein